MLGSLFLASILDTKEIKCDQPKISVAYLWCYLGYGVDYFFEKFIFVRFRNKVCSL